MCITEVGVFMFHEDGVHLHYFLCQSGAALFFTTLCYANPLRSQVPLDTFMYRVFIEEPFDRNNTARYSRFAPLLLKSLAL